MKLLIILVILLTAITGAIGQDTPKAVLVDEHGRIPCDDSLGRIDVFFAELHSDPNSRGLVVLSSPQDEKPHAVWRQRMIEAHAKWRGFDQPIEFIRTRAENEFQIQFWRVPPGAESPAIKEIDMSYSLSKDKKPFMFASEYYYGAHICPDLPEPPMFAEFLKANPSSRGNIVVRDTSLARAKSKSGRIVRELGRLGVPRSRLNVFPIKVRYIASDQPIIEYWYLS